MCKDSKKKFNRTTNYELRIYPNHGAITNYELRSEAEYSIYSVIGQKVLQGKLQDKKTVINPKCPLENISRIINNLFFLFSNGHH